MAQQNAGGPEHPKEEATPVMIDVSSTSVSSNFIRLAEQGKLRELVKLHSKREKLVRRLSSTQKMLADCNNDAWLLKFYEQTRKAGRNYGPALMERAYRLELRKAALVAELTRIGGRIEEIEPGSTPASSQPRKGTGKPTAKMSRATVPNVSALVGARKIVIRKYAHLSNETICKKLDAELGRSFRFF
jgi:hypothetical protein